MLCRFLPLVLVHAGEERERERGRERDYICSSHLGLIRWRIGTCQKIETICDKPRQEYTVTSRLLFSSTQGCIVPSHLSLLILAGNILASHHLSVLVHAGIHCCFSPLASRLRRDHSGFPPPLGSCPRRDTLLFFSSRFSSSQGPFWLPPSSRFLSTQGYIATSHLSVLGPQGYTATRYLFILALATSSPRSATHKASPPCTPCVGRPVTNP